MSYRAALLNPTENTTMKLCFDSIEEVKDFVTQLKGTRGGKGNKDETDTNTTSGTSGAPAPLQPPAGGVDMGGTQFAPPAGTFGAAGPGAGFPAGPSPEAAALVARIVAKTDSAIAGGQNPEQARAWFAGQCGPEAANATLDQIKGTYLPKLAVPQLQQIASLLAA